MSKLINNSLRASLITSGNLKAATHFVANAAKQGISESQAAAIAARRAEMQRKPAVSSKQGAAK